MYPTDKSTEYAAGFDCGYYGPDKTNSNYKLFSTPEKLHEWESGKRDGEQAKEHKEKLIARFTAAAPRCHHVHQEGLQEPNNLTVFDTAGRVMIFTRDGRTGIINPKDLTQCYEISASEFLQLRDLYNKTADPLLEGGKK